MSAEYHLLAYYCVAIKYISYQILLSILRLCRLLIFPEMYEWKQLSSEYITSLSLSISHKRNLYEGQSKPLGIAIIRQTTISSEYWGDLVSQNRWSSRWRWWWLLYWKKATCMSAQSAHIRPCAYVSRSFI